MSTTLMMLSKNPKRIMSLIRIKPDPKTIAFGGVPTGIINAILAPSVSAIAKETNGRPVCCAKMPTTGIIKVTIAKLEISSVIKMATAASMTIAVTNPRP